MEIKARLHSDVAGNAKMLQDKLIASTPGLADLSTTLSQFFGQELQSHKSELLELYSIVGECVVSDSTKILGIEQNIK